MASWNQSGGNWGASAQSWSGGGGAAAGGGGGGQSWGAAPAQQASAGGNSWGQQGGGQQAGGQSWNQQSQQAAPQGGQSWNQQSQQGQASGGGASWQQQGQGQSGGGSWNQQATPAAAPAATPSWGGNANSGSWGASAQPSKMITVSGCSHNTIGSIVRGAFSVHSDNHNKPVYKKDTQVSGLDVMIYFWDERDGPSQAGWWFGPKVGGEQVWAYNPDTTSAAPPKGGWQVPYGGPVDASFVVSEGGGAGAGGWAQPQAQQPQQQSWQQPQQQQQQQQQQSWGAQAAPAQPQQQQQSWGGNQGQQAWGQQAGQQQNQQQMAQQREAARQEQIRQQQQQAQQAQVDQRARMQQQQAAQAEQWRQKQEAQANAKQAQMMEMQRRQAENKAKLEEARMKQQQEQKRKIEEMQRLREEAVKRKQEEEQRQKEEIIKKKEEEERKRAESRATFAIRRIIQKVRVSTPESLVVLEKELEAELEKELANCGTQAEKMKEEADRGLEQAKKRVEQIAEERRKEEEKKLEFENLRKEKQEKAKALCAQLQELVEAAESQGESLKELVKEMESAEPGITSKDVETTFAKITEAENECKTAAQTCMDLVKSESATMKDPAAEQETKQACAKLLKRIQEGGVNVEATMASARGAKAKAFKKAAAHEKTKVLEKTFKKYDKDSDKALSQKEVMAYANGEFKVKLEKDTLDWVWKSLVEEGSKGVKLEKLHSLSSIIGVTREMARDKQRVADRIQKEKVIGGLRDAVKAKCGAAAKFVIAADKAVKQIEDEAGAWMKKARAMDSDTLIAKCDTVDKKMQAVNAAYEKAKKEMGKAEAGLDPKYEKELKEYKAKEAKKSEMDMGRMDGRIERVKVISRRFREQAKYREVEGLEKVKAKALKVIRHNQATKDLSMDGLFDLFANGKEQIKVKDWLSFFASAEMEVRAVTILKAEGEEEKDAEMEEQKDETAEAEKEGEEKEEAEKAEEEKKADEETAKDGEEKKDEAEADKKDDEEKKDGEEKKEEEKKVEVKKPAPKKKEEEKPAPPEKIEISEDELSRLFGYLDDEESGYLSKERFLQLNKRYMKVIKEAAMTSEMSMPGMSGSKALRKLEKGEVVEVLKGPLKDGAIKVPRIQCKAQKDDLEGWVTVAGNAGTVYLEDASLLFKVVKKTVLTESFETNGEANDSNKLNSGTVLEVRELPRKDESSGVTRMKGRVRAKDVQIGWVTTLNKEGKVFCKAV